MIWDIQMRLRVEDDKVEEAKSRMNELGLEFDTRPRFTTVQAWMVDAVELLKFEPASLLPGSGEPEHRGTVRRSMGRGPQQ